MHDPQLFAIDGLAAYSYTLSNREGTAPVAVSSALILARKVHETAELLAHSPSDAILLVR